jgi:hypothetical protein
MHAIRRRVYRVALQLPPPRRPICTLTTPSRCSLSLHYFSSSRPRRPCLLPLFSSNSTPGNPFIPSRTALPPKSFIASQSGPPIFTASPSTMLLQMQADPPLPPPSPPAPLCSLVILNHFCNLIQQLTLSPLPPFPSLQAYLLIACA